jgi:hypothetical protein
MGFKPKKQKPVNDRHSHYNLSKQQQKIGLILYALALQHPDGKVTISKESMYTARKWQDNGDDMAVYFIDNADGSVTISTAPEENSDDASISDE